MDTGYFSGSRSDGETLVQASFHADQWCGWVRGRFGVISATSWQDILATALERYTLSDIEVISLIIDDDRYNYHTSKLLASALSLAVMEQVNG